MSRWLLLGALVVWQASASSRGFLLVPIESDRILTAYSRSVAYDDILAAVQKKLTAGLLAKGVAKLSAVKDGDCCIVRLDLTQAVYDQKAFGISARIAVVVSIEAAGFSKRFVGEAKARKFGRLTVEKRMEDAADDLVKAVASDEALMKALSLNP